MNRHFKFASWLSAAAFLLAWTSLNMRSKADPATPAQPADLQALVQMQGSNPGVYAQVSINSPVMFTRLKFSSQNAKKNASYQFFLDAKEKQPATTVSILSVEPSSHEILVNIQDSRKFLEKDAALYVKITFPITASSDQGTKTIPPKIWEVQKYFNTFALVHPNWFSDSIKYGGSVTNAAKDLLTGANISNFLSDASGLKLSGGLKGTVPITTSTIGNIPFDSEFVGSANADVALNAFNKNDNYFDSVSFDGKYLVEPVSDFSPAIVTSSNGTETMPNRPALTLAPAFGADFNVQSDKSFAHVDMLEGVTAQAFIDGPWLEQIYAACLKSKNVTIVPPEPALFGQLTASHVDHLSGDSGRGPWIVTAELDWTKPLLYYVWKNSTDTTPPGPGDDKTVAPPASTPKGLHWPFVSAEVDFVTSGDIEYDFSPGKVHDKFGIGLQCKLTTEKKPKAPSTKTCCIVKWAESAWNGFAYGDPVISVRYEDGSLAPTFQHYGGFLAGLGWSF
jgi:hypothetical protein